MAFTFALLAALLLTAIFLHRAGHPLPGPLLALLAITLTVAGLYTASLEDLRSNIRDQTPEVIQIGQQRVTLTRGERVCLSEYARRGQPLTREVTFTAAVIRVARRVTPEGLRPVATFKGAAASPCVLPTRP